MKWSKGTAERVRVLVLSGNLGDGHRQAAKALAEASRLGTREAVDTEVVDFMQRVYPQLQHVVKYGFLKMVEKTPSIYGYLYHRTKYDEGLSPLFSLFLRLGRRALLRLAAEYRPDAIICTFPLAAAAVSLLKEEGRLHVPLITVITDHTDHALWLNPATDLYLVGSEQVASALRARGIASSRVAVSGIPVAPRFHAEEDRTVVRQELGLQPDMPVVLVMGGGGGLLSEGIRSLLRSEAVCAGMQLVIVCGSNRAVMRELEEELAHRPSGRVRLLGFAEDIHRWMSAADLLLTKPGGLTTSEAVAKALPMLLYKPIPGQEEDNAAVLVRAGVAVQAEGGRALTDQLLELVHDPARLAHMRGRAEAFRIARPAERAWEAVLALRPRPQPELAPRPELSMSKAW
ncbi:processive 1,2-diacylglycerol beta-glucosyltransferase [Paenibacillus mucilaginosus]|uniref:MGDG synthase family glycosyltransferase n=1 Tax=Paenibacillus mucilaginosus TaxID=61624 RepID=UPI003D198776